jgi:hypothetical protein
LILDEIYSVEWKSGTWRLKKSSGTAFKLWGDDGWANFSCYAKLLVVGGIILGEPSVMEQIESRNPDVARRYKELQNTYRGWSDEIVQSVKAKSPEFESAIVESRGPWNPFAGQQQSQPPAATNNQPTNNGPPSYQLPPAAESTNPFDQPPTQVPLPTGGGYDTAQRPTWPQ